MNPVKRIAANCIPVKCILVLEKQQENAEDGAKVTGGLPNCLIDVLGKSVLQRAIEAFLSSAVDEVVVVADEHLVTTALSEQVKTARLVPANVGLLWRTAEQVFLSLAESAPMFFWSA